MSNANTFLMHNHVVHVLTIVPKDINDMKKNKVTVLVSSSLIWCNVREKGLSKRGKNTYHYVYEQ
jgi:hypothetical protein